MSDLFRTTLIMSISGGVVSLLLFALKPLVRSRLPKSTQYYMWLVVVAVLLIPVSIFVKLPAASEAAPVVMSPSNVVEKYFITGEEEMDRLGALDNLEPREASNRTYVQAAEQAKSPIAGVFTIFVFFWPYGVLIALLYYIINYSVFIRLYRRRNTIAAADENAMLAELCGNRRLPLLYRNPLAATPMLIGVFNPAIILPGKEYSEAQLRSVLRHELTHLRRKDVLVKWLSVLVAAVHWFNPIVWLVRREIDRACELSCDEAVIHNLDADGKQSYGETLIYVAADSKTPHAVLSTTMCEEKKALKERLGAIMKSKKHTRLAIILSVALLLAVGGTALALGAGNRITNNLEYLEIATLINSPQEEVYGRIGNPHGTLNGIDVFIIDGKEIRITYDENNCVNQINYNGEAVVNAPGFTNDGAARNMTLNDVRAIAQKIGPDLTYGDLRDFTGVDVGSGLYIMNYDIEGGEYHLMVGSGSADLHTPVMYAYLAQAGGAFDVDDCIDIRYYDVDKYLADGTRELARPLPEPRPTATSLPQPAANLDDAIALPQPAASLDDAIDIAIASHNNGRYGGGGDFTAASHVTLKTAESGNLVTVYIMAFYAEYSNDGGIRETAGSHIPVAITLEKTSFGLVEYWEAKDGSYYLPSIKEKFPSDIWDKIDTQLYSRQQQENCLQKAKTHYANLPPITAESSLYQAYYQVALKLSSFKNNILTVKANKYRGPLGAVGAEFTVRFKDGQWTVDEPEMVWMA